MKLLTKGYNQEGKSVTEGERKGALELAHSMSYDYKWNEKGIYTTLMYGEHYDTTLYIFDKLQLLNEKKNNETFSNGNSRNDVIIKYLCWNYY